ncbi:MAG: helix-turn-helix domain-containing protein [Anaerolineae bacterium]
MQHSNNTRRSGRPLRITWNEDEAHLKQRYEHERHPDRRLRLRVFLLIRQGHTLREISEELGVGYRTIQQWVAWYRTGGIDEVLLRLPGYRAPGTSSRLSSRQLEHLRKRASRGDWESVNDVVDWVSQTWDIEYTYQGMYALLRREAIPVPSA